jgi:hypothetical protein
MPQEIVSQVAINLRADRLSNVAKIDNANIDYSNLISTMAIEPTRASETATFPPAL